MKFVPVSEVSTGPLILVVEDDPAYARIMVDLARDAGFKVNGASVRIVSSRIGRSLDMDAIAQAIIDAQPYPKGCAATKKIGPAANVNQ